ncbi:MAG: tyrosine-type recombinase/integrase [Rhabdaerophilum sp.]
MALTDVSIRALKSKPTRQKISDGEGLQIWVLPTGTKVWRYAYRYEGSQKALALGQYPAVGLAEARRRRDEAKAQLANGVDPGRHKKRQRADKAVSEANTFSVLATELLAKKQREGKASATIGKREWLYSLANDAIGSLPVADITAPDVLAVLQSVEKKGHLETARRMRSAIGEVFRFAIATGRATSDPTFALRGALTTPKVKHRAALTDPKAFGELLRAIEGFQGQPTTQAALKLMAYLFPRPGELRMAEWSEFDLPNAVWTVPAKRMKMRREHRVPLAKQAIAILASIQPLTDYSAFVLPAVSNPKRPMSENTLNAALRRMGFGQDDMTSHGFRATASTLLNESGKFSPDAIERALAHQEVDAVRRAYARGEHWKERVAMMDWWAGHVDALRDGANIIPLHRKERK